MVWVDIGNPNVVSFKEPWMDQAVDVTSTGKVQVTESVAERLVEERENASIAGEEDEDPTPDNDDGE